MDKKTRNNDNIKQVKEVLYAANYHCGSNMHGTTGDIEFWVGPGSAPVIALQFYKNDDGFELWIPISQSNRMDETLEALRKATTPARALAV
jgi:hypothetical protein